MPFLDGQEEDWDGDVIKGHRPFITAVGAGTTYPDYKPAPFIVSQAVEGVDMVTVVTEGIFSYCGVKVKIDTDRHIGAERAYVRVDGEAIGHVMTGEYGSSMLSLGGVLHLTGGSKKEGRVTCDALMRLCNREAVEVTIDDGATVILQAGQAPIINGVPEKLMRVGCGSATIGMFAKQWVGHVDEVVVVDDHITGVLSEHQAGKLLDVPPTGIKMKGRRSTPGRYFQVAHPGTGWGGTDVDDPLTILNPFDAKVAWPGLRMLMVSTTGEQWAYYELDAGSGAAGGGGSGGDPGFCRADCRELRAFGVFGAVYGRRWWVVAGGSDDQSGAADAVGEGGFDAGVLWRGLGLCLAGGRDHGDGGCDGDAIEFVWLCADSGIGRTD